MPDITQTLLSNAQDTTINGGTYVAAGDQHNNTLPDGQQTNHFYGAVSMTVQISNQGSSPIRPVGGEGPSQSPESRPFTPQLFRYQSSTVSQSHADLIAAWTDKNLSDDYSVCWLHAPVRCGKTSVALTLVEKGPQSCATSFIISRGDGTKPQKMIVDELAEGLDESMPGIADDYTKELKRRRLFEARSGDSSIQVDLFVASFQALIAVAERWGPPHQSKGTIKDFFAKLLARSESTQNCQSRLVILDGLDQSGCDGASLRRVVDIILKSVEAGACPLRFLICTRPNPLLGNVFQRYPFVKHIDLQKSLSPEIPNYLRSEMERIRVEHDLPEEWPSGDELEALLGLAGDHLGSASGFVKFVGDAANNGNICESPPTLLKMGLSLVDKNDSDIICPTPDLDHDYTQILVHVSASGKKYGFVVDVLASILCLQKAGESSSRNLIDTLLGLPLGTAGTPLPLVMHSMLHIPTIKFPDQDILILQPLCIEFLNDPGRSKGFFIDRPVFHGFLVQRWFQLLKTITPDWYAATPQLVRTLWERWAYFCLGYPGRPSEVIVTSLRDLDLKALFNTALSFMWSGQRGLFCSPFLSIRTLAGWLETHAAEEGVQPLFEYYKDAAQTNVFVSLSRKDGAPVGERHTELRECFADILVLGMAGCKHECTRTNALISRARGLFKDPSAEFEISVVGVGRRPRYSSDFHPHAIAFGQESFVRVAKSLMAAADVSTNSEGLPGYFLNVLGSSLLSLCGNDPELLPACKRLTRTLFDTFYEDHQDEVVGCLKKVRHWLELFPQSDADIRRFVGEVDEKILGRKDTTISGPKPGEVSGHTWRSLGIIKSGAAGLLSPRLYTHNQAVLGYPQTTKACGKGSFV
ncbi:hypothetical protein PM082_017802 [Marasmius tenuissimus]|nr:hypothetical protein PM082_017802 [Marasmius tenuissimus]